MTDITRAIEGAKDGSIDVKPMDDGRYFLTSQTPWWRSMVTADELAALRAAYPMKFKEM